MNIIHKCSLPGPQLSPESNAKAVESYQQMLKATGGSTVEHLRNCAASASVETLAHYMRCVDTGIQLIMTARFFWINFCSRLLLINLGHCHCNHLSLKFSAFFIPQYELFV